MKDKPVMVGFEITVNKEVLKMKQVKIKDPVNVMLEELVNKRKDELNPANNKQGIVEELIIKAHKREIKKG